MLFAQEKESIEGASDMYDSLIVRIFRKDILGNAKLVLIQVWSLLKKGMRASRLLFSAA